ncbi:unnamed protein product [Thelazia callipaeda]|uniref:RNA-directed RNA polymerase n=1 Tax=Thelazia callipaeda TaxID=103827 RepID=A0A0N5CLU6_THECL|nr:unnamed protein product [Thelazia callipaeda]
MVFGSDEVDPTSDAKAWEEPLNLKVVLMSDDTVLIAQLTDVLPSYSLKYEKTLQKLGNVIPNEHFIKVGLDVVEHKIGIHDYGSPWVELHIDVMSPSWNQSFLKMVSTFQVLTKGFTGKDTPVLEASERGFFIKDCIPVHLNIDLHSVHHGNLFDQGTFYSHHTREISESVKDEELADYIKVLSVLLTYDVCSPMYVDFEHDRSYFTVRFAVLDGYKLRENSVPKDATIIEGSMFCLKIRYTSLRRILVDTKVPWARIYVTRIYFQLNYPPEIRRFRQKLAQRGSLESLGERFRYYPETDHDTKDKSYSIMAINDSPVLCLQFTDSMNEETLYTLLSRLHVRASLPIQFASVQHYYFSVLNYVSLPVRVIGCDYRKSVTEEKLLQNPQSYKPVEPVVDKYWSSKLKSFSFALEYLIAALLSRGAVVKDQLLRSIEARNCFLEHVIENYEQDFAVTLEVLERLINMVDEMKTIPPLMIAFDHIRNSIFDKKDLLADIYNRSYEEGFQRVRKAVITPTRMLLVIPELLMGNRVLREFDESGNGALRIQFRDDDGTRLRRSSAGIYLIETTVHNCLLHGIHISDRHFVYLASSNSQMRDNGCYFFDDGKGGKVGIIREKLGKFDHTNIPKLMSRMGQCFTQSKESDVTLRRKKYNKTYDIVGGRDSQDEPYIFSDGVGKLSEDFAEEIAKDLGLGRCVPSCFQIRHRGLKGVLSVDPALRQRRIWAEKHELIDDNSKTEKVNDLDVVFRPSQDKFHAPRKVAVEIVKFSSPTPVCLNRPFINILDQVSEMQGFDVHNRIIQRVHDLLDRQLMYLSDAMMSEDRCRERLGEFPRRVNVKYLSVARGFCLTQEPFFHSLLIASFHFTLQKQLFKEQIQIPPKLGRSMFGILDETGLLQYGQIFVQFTNNVAIKTPSKAAAKTILEGPVMVTKNPSIVAGDVRIFQAIDIPELRHLVDVIVFPQHGPRPHTDEMAGSDLDGDEYSVIWDDQLLFHHNEEPMDFSKLIRAPNELKEEEVVREMRRFYVEYIKQDSIGVIANAFLVNSDVYGINSPICLKIAEKHSQSVDFPKTGRPPEPLVREWTLGTDGEMLPPERPERWPDFMCKTHEPSYVSYRLVGQLYRRIQLIHDVLTLSTGESLDVDLDPMLEYEGWESFEEEAKLTWDAYSAHVKALMENYGIEDEGQLFSGCFIKIRNRIGDRDTDDMSQFNTNFIIERKLTNIFMSFRQNFFASFGGFMECTQPDDDFHNREMIERRFCACPTVEMKKKASAYYNICYRKSNQYRCRRLLSFPWVAWDILGEIKKENCVLKSQKFLAADPLSEHVTNVITRFCRNNEVDFYQTMECLKKSTAKCGVIKRYCDKYLGLDKLFYLLCKWGEHQHLFTKCVKQEHLCLLLIQYGLGHLKGENLRSNIFLEQVNEITTENPDDARDLGKLVGGIGRCLLLFFQYLSSRSFETVKLINFAEPNLGYHSLMMRGQWLDLHMAAVRTFYRIVLTSRFDIRSLYKSTQLSPNNFNLFEGPKLIFNLFKFQLPALLETEPFTVELPDNLTFHDDILKDKLRRNSGVRYIHLRRVIQKKSRILISAFGTMESLHRLRDILAVKPLSTPHSDSKERFDIMLRLTYDRIQALP